MEESKDHIKIDGMQLPMFGSKPFSDVKRRFMDVVRYKEMYVPNSVNRPQNQDGGYDSDDGWHPEVYESPAVSRKALNLINMMCDDGDRDFIAHARNPEDALEMLENKYDGDEALRYLCAKDDLDNLVKKSSESISQYCTRARRIMGRLTAVGQGITENSLVVDLCKGLPAEYNDAKRAYMQDTSHISRFKLSTFQAKMQLEENAIKMNLFTKPTANTTKGRDTQGKDDTVPALRVQTQDNSSKNPGKPYARGGGRGRGRGRGRGNRQFGNKREGDRNYRGSKRKINGKCDYCNIKGHKEVDCFLKQKHEKQGRLNPNFQSDRGRFMQNDQRSDRDRSHNARANQAVAEDFAPLPPVNHGAQRNTINAFMGLDDGFYDQGTYTSGVSSPTLACLLDSGCENHVTPIKHLLHDFKPIKGKGVVVGNGQNLPAQGVGSLHVSAKLSNGKTRNFKITNVWYVPGLISTLISVNQLQDHDLIAMIRGRDIVYHDKHFQELFIAKYSAGNGYVCQWGIACSETQAKALFTKSPREDALLWHARLGHPSHEVLSEMVKNDHATGINISHREVEKFKDDVCPICVQSKLSRKPYKPSKNRPEDICHTISSDLTGPYQVPTIGGAYYMHMVVDHASDNWETTTLKNKSDCESKLKEVINKWEKQTGKHVKILRSDNGGEYIDGLLNEWLKSKGIIHQYSLPKEKQQNGKAENAIKTCNNIARALLYQAGLPLSLWGEAVAHAAYLHNVRYSHTLRSTPHNKFHGQTPNLDRLRTFGCLTYYRVPDEDRQKLDPKALLGHYVGVDPTSKAVRVLIRRPNGRLGIRLCRDIVTVEKYLTHPGVPAVQATDFVSQNPPGLGTPQGCLFDEQSKRDVSQAHDRLPIFPPHHSEWSAGSGEVNGIRLPEPTGLVEPEEVADARLPEPSGLAEPQRVLLPAPRQTDVSQGGSELYDTNEQDGVIEDFVEKANMPSTEESIQRPHRNRAPPDRYEPNDFRIKKFKVGPDLKRCYQIMGVTNPILNAIALSAVIEVEGYEPMSYHDAMQCPDWDMWKEALEAELNSLLENGTWELVKRETWMKVIPCKWVFKIKRDADGNIERYKCRLVAGGHRQKFGVDYDETFAPVSKATTLRVFLTVASKRKWAVHQLDIKTAFLHGEIDTNVYMQQPEGFQEGTNLVCKLQKCLYGLKQAPKAWYEKLSMHLSDLGFAPATADPSLWIGSPYGKCVFISLVVDDTLITCEDESHTQKVIKAILDRFPGNTSHAQWYVGMKLNWLDDGSVILTQRAHIEKILKDHVLQHIRPCTVPAPTTAKFTKQGHALDASTYHYASLVGALLYLSCYTRPDICAVVNRLAKFISCPTKELWDLAVHLCGYLKYTADFGLHLGRNDTIGMYCDADFASDIDKRRSHTGWVFLLYGSAVCWQSRCQPTVAASTTEAEYQAISMSAREALWLKQLLPLFNVPCAHLQIRSDSTGAVNSIRNSQVSQRTKHIDVMHHFVRERVMRREIDLQWVAGTKNVADMLTKPLPREKHEWSCHKIGILDSNKMPSRVYKKKVNNKQR